MKPFKRLASDLNYNKFLLKPRNSKKAKAMNTEASEMTEAQAAPSSPIKSQTKKEESHFVEAIDAPPATIDENPVKP